MMAGRGTTGQGVAGGPARHLPVLIDEVMRCLAPGAGGTFIDGTFGAGGYSRASLAAGASGSAIARDPVAGAAGAALAREAGGRLAVVEGRFADLDAIAAAHGKTRVDGVVLDIGVSSMQLDDPERGFSFRADGPLDMRMGAAGPTAADIVNRFEPRDLARVIAVLGEEKRARAVAAAIAAARERRPLTGTAELAEIVARAVGRRGVDQIHPATRTFQALRIFVNRELDELADALAASERVLAEGGRLVVVAFHSLEDRIVKRFLAERSETRPRGSRHLPQETPPSPTFELLTRGAVVPDAEEIARNPRSRSARLRAARRTAAPPRRLDRRAIGVPELPEFGVGRA
jgi:16S rRNA (cytosine1402-N4)-methyltransferase